ncbi:hypothetical protein ACFT4A_26820 [Streptomyces sp. NPDC057099]|uniref:hypothetical protein n=1 Tax=Streptomyces sp. NPDC057099 TaxID=3346019 RepID=UPI00362BB44A
MVDTADSGARTVPRQAAAQERLLLALEEACAAAGIDRGTCDRQDRGDGELLILPPGVVETTVVPELLRVLTVSLRRDNLGRTEPERLRVRTAAAVGIVHRSALGFAGDGVVEACRLVDAGALKEAFRAAPWAEVSFAVGEELYRDLVRHGYDGLPPDSFRPLTPVVDGRPFRAWLSLFGPGGELSPGPDRPAAHNRQPGSTSVEVSASRTAGSWIEPRFDLGAPFTTAALWGLEHRGGQGGGTEGHQHHEDDGRTPGGPTASGSSGHRAAQQSRHGHMVDPEDLSEQQDAFHGSDLDTGEDNGSTTADSWEGGDSSLPDDEGWP